ncbi:MAG: hypothetical protein ACI8QC_002027 [Planctomycetota bacterium]|jgi:hypothetical protein
MAKAVPRKPLIASTLRTVYGNTDRSLIENFPAVTKNPQSPRSQGPAIALRAMNARV